MKLSIQVSSGLISDKWLSLAHQAEEYGFHGIHVADRVDDIRILWPSLQALKSES